MEELPVVRLQEDGVASSIPTLHTVKEAASALSLSEKSIRRMLKDGRLRAHYIGQIVRVSLETAMPETEDQGPPEVHHMPETKEELLCGKLRYTAEESGVVGGFRVPLGASDPAEARARLERGRAVYASLTAQGKRASDCGAVAIRKNGALTHIKVRLRPGAERVMRRVPAEVAKQLTSDEDVERFCLAWVAVHTETTAAATALDQPVAVLTCNGLAKSWFSGELREKHPGYIREKKSVRDDEIRYWKYIAPVIGQRRVTQLLGEAVQEACDGIVKHMQETNPDLSTATQRQVLQVFSRMLSIAVFPLRALPRNDFPRERMPRPSRRKAFSYLFPEEDRTLLGCTKVALHHRLFLGILSREGLRASELRNLEWNDLDLTHGLLHLNENKTESPRTWVLDPGVVRALILWQELCSPKARRSPYVIVDRSSGRRIASGKASKQLRNALGHAKVAREALLSETESRMAIRGHDLRATFVTLALAAGKTEAWVTDRTGHTSSTMLYRYKRAARTHAEAQLGQLAPLDEAIPELSTKNEA